MKKYILELVVLLIQLFMFYIFPMFAGPTDAIGMVILMLLCTLLLSMILGVLSDKKLKFLYSLVIAILFIPSVFIYYNESALVHSLWYLIISSIGILLGIVIRFVVNKFIK